MNIADVITRHARATPQAIAVAERGHEWSYLEFDRAIWRAAALFRERGLAPGDMVGVSMASSALHLVVGYALARLGAIQISLPLRESASVREGLARRFRCAAVIADGDADAAWLDGEQEADHDESLRAAGGDAPWKVVLTSGTTGVPKAVLQSHSMHLAWRELTQGAIPLQPDERYLALVELDFFSGFRVCTDVHWVGGAVLVGETAGTPQAFLEAVERTRANYLYVTPLHLHQLLAVLPAGRLGLPGLRRLRTGSMTVSQTLRREILERLTPNLAVAYGTNDVGSPLTLGQGEILDRYPGSVGKPVPGVELRITDDEGRSLPAGEAGLVCVRAPGMPVGYVDDAEASARAFRDSWYYPGDLGMLSDDGVLFLKGRTDDLMNFDGLKIYPSEVEALLLEHPAVAEAAAFPLASAQHQHLPAAAVVTREKVDADALHRFLLERLGPRAPLWVAVTKSLPRNAAGKVDKHELARLFKELLKKK